MRKYWRAITVLAVLFTAGLFVIRSASIAVMRGMGFPSHEDNASSRAALLAMHASLHPGDSEGAVGTVFERVRTPELKLSRYRDEYIDITMPLEFGASDWRLLVELQSGVVHALRLRTSDGPAPRGAPPDKVAAGLGVDGAADVHDPALRPRPPTS